MTKCLIVDDEPIARQILEGYIKEVPNLQLMGSCKNALEAMEFIRSNNVDLMFLDINMPKLTGLNMLRAMAVAPKVIITTAYEEYALEGFDLSVLDYLLKPFSFERFLQATLKVKVQQPKIELAESISTNTTDSIFVKSDKKYIKLFFKDISHIEAYGNYVKIHEKKTILVSQTLSSFVELLPDDFFRIHKSYVINTSNILSLEGNQIKISDDTHLPIGKSYKSAVLKRILPADNR